MVGLPIALIASFSRIVWRTLLCTEGVGLIASAATFPEASPGAYYLGGGCLFLAASGVGLRWLLRNVDTTDGSAALYATGRPAVATVLSLTETGGSVNDNPVVLLTVRMEPVGGIPAFEATLRAAVSRISAPAAGDRYAAYYDPVEPDRFTLVLAGEEVPGDVAQLRDRVEAETRAAAVAPVVDPLDRLAELNNQRLAGTLSEADFLRYKAELLR